MPSQGSGSKRRSGGPFDDDNNNKSSGKRSRVSRACDQCRVAREKCDGVQPICLTCASSSRECTYTINPKKRGIQPGYIRSLELTLAWLFNTHPDCESSLNRKLALEGAASILISRDGSESNKLHKSWRRSKFCKDVDLLLSGAEAVGPEEGKSPDSDGQDTEVGDSANSTDLTAISSNNRHAAIPQSPMDPQSRSTPRGADQANTLQQSTLPSNIWRLFDIYFAYTHCWFPISEKHDVLKITYSYPEAGLELSSNMTDSGNHAELWSIFALASLQDQSTVTTEDNADTRLNPRKLYDTARMLIPHELGSLDLGHVKALLILGLINLTQSAPEAAWLLVGTAARILAILESRTTSATFNPRFKHVYTGCYLLDNVVSMQLARRPYLLSTDLARIGKISEDGLEEWQPWTGCLYSTSQQHRPTTRAPVLSLSSFNHLSNIVGILACSDAVESVRKPSTSGFFSRLGEWKASLPMTFDHIRRESMITPPTPTAALLHLTYHCSCAILQAASQSSVLRVIELLELSRDSLGLVALPPVLISLLEVVTRSQSFEHLDQVFKVRFQRVREDHITSWHQALAGPRYSPRRASSSGSRRLIEPSSAHSRQSFGSANVQIPTPESLQVPLHPSFIPIGHSTPSAESVRPQTGSTLLDDLLPDMNPTAPQQFQSASYRSGPPRVQAQNLNTQQYTDAYNAPLMEHRGSSASRDMENFFDELASLDGAEQPDNQPQFLQNLGFAPDADMADLLASDFGQFNNLFPSFINQPDNVYPGVNEAPLYDTS